MVDIQTFFNFAGICLQIIGFILTIRAVKEIRSLTQVGGLLGFSHDPKIRVPTGIENPKTYKTGIVLVIAGLSLQIITILLVEAGLLG